MRRYLFAILAGFLVLTFLPFNISAPSAQTKPLYDVTKVAENVYSFRYIFHRGEFIVTDDGVIVIDPISPEAAKALDGEIKKITKQPVKLVIYSHNHWDHIRGAKIFKDQGAKIIQHKLAADDVRPNKDIVPADETFSGEKHVVKLGKQTVEIYYKGKSHGTGLVVMRLMPQRALITPDLVTPGRVAFQIMPGYFPAQWIKTLKRIETEIDFDFIIPEHGPAKAGKEAVREQREYVEALTAAAIKAVKATGNPYAWPKIFKMVNADMEPKYGKWAGYKTMMGMNLRRILAQERTGW